jgi:hypothetical protein
MKAFLKSQIFLLLIGLGVSVQIIGCEVNDDPSDEVRSVIVDGNSRFNQSMLEAMLSGLRIEPLSEDEIGGLNLMREEEKLAYDVYSYLYQRWHLKIFDNIARSESTHMDAMLTLLDRYSLEDPAEGQTHGQFTDKVLQQLYYELTHSGSQSELEALKVGALIEEIDILDLQQQLDRVVDNQDVIVVYQNLQKGSRNHLRAFVRNMSARGYTYSPQRMTRGQFDTIIDAPMERGSL